MTASGIDCNGDIDVDGHTNLDNVSIAGVATLTSGSNQILFNTDNGNIEITRATGGPFIDFKNSAAEDFDVRIQSSGTGGRNIQMRSSDGTGALLGYANNSYDLGSSSVNWRHLYVNNVNIAGVTTITNAYGYLYLEGLAPSVHFKDTSSGTPTFRLMGEGGSFYVQNTTNPSNSLIINTATKQATFGGGVDVGGDLDVDGHTNLDNVSIAGITTFTNGFVNLKPSGGGNAHFRILSTGTGDAGIFFDAANGDIAGSDYFFIGQQNNLDFVINGSTNAGNIDFQRGGTTKVRITSGGEVLIGGIRTSNTGFGNKVLISGGTLGLDGNGSNIGMHWHRDSGDTEGYIGIGDWAVTGGGDNDFGFSAKGDLLFGTSSNSWSQKFIIGDNRYSKFGTGTPKATVDIKQIGNSWEDSLLIQHDNANTGWNIHAERTNSALWFGYNSDTSAALTDQNASQVLHLNSNRTVSIVTSQTSYELTIGGISGGPTLWLRDSGTTGTPRLLFGSTAGALIGAISYNNPNDYMSFYTNGTEHIRIDSSGHFKPVSDATRDLGTSSLRWRNVYTTDLQLSNENTGGNEVDGTEGNWTLQEGESDIYMINRKTGKKYKMMLQEVD